MKRKANHIMGSSNVFADLGFHNAEEMLAKAELANRIIQLIRQRNLTQARAATLLGVDQPKISALRRGRLSGFSLERLLRFLVCLGSDVRIIVGRRRNGHRGPAHLLVA